MEVILPVFLFEHNMHVYAKWEIEKFKTYCFLTDIYNNQANLSLAI